MKSRSSYECLISPFILFLEHDSNLNHTHVYLGRLYLFHFCIPEQAVVDRTINDICILFKCSRHNLNVVCFHVKLVSESIFNYLVAVLPSLTYWYTLMERIITIRIICFICTDFVITHEYQVSMLGRSKQYLGKIILVFLFRKCGNMILIQMSSIVPTGVHDY